MITIKKKGNSETKRIVWARNMLLDTDLFARTETEVLHNLAQYGYEIFYISGHSHKRIELNNSGIHLFSIPAGENSIPIKLHLLFLGVQFFLFPIYLPKIKPDFVIVDWDSLFGILPMLPFYRLLGTRIILDVRSTPTPIQGFSKKPGLQMYLLDLAFNVSVSIAKKKLDGITIITELMKKHIVTKFSLDADRIGVWSSGVSTDLFKSEKYHTENLREKLRLNGKFVVMYHGSLSQSRGIMNAIKAMISVRNLYPNVVLLLLGSGLAPTIEEEMRKSISENGIEDNVIIHNPVDYVDVPKYIDICDVGIVPLLDLPQWRNQCPLKLLEYLSMEKVVVLSDIPCHREVVGNSECGIYLSSITPEGIAASISYAIDNKDALKEWGIKGRVIVKNKYAWQRIAKNLDDYLRYIENK